MYGRPPGSPREDPLVIGPFVVIARIPGRPGVSDYRYVETNVDTFFQQVIESSRIILRPCTRTLIKWMPPEFAERFFRLRHSKRPTATR